MSKLNLNACHLQIYRKLGYSFFFFEYSSFWKIKSTIIIFVSFKSPYLAKSAFEMRVSIVPVSINAPTIICHRISILSGYKWASIYYSYLNEFFTTWVYLCICWNFTKGFNMTLLIFFTKAYHLTAAKTSVLIF